MNPIALIRNIYHSLKICSSCSDAWRCLQVMYSYKCFLKPWKKTDYQISFRYPYPINNIRVVIRNDADWFIFGEVFEKQHYDLPLQSTPDTILDLGANVGLTTIFFARKYPSAEIACVEPMPNNLNLLNKNLVLNNVTAKVFAAAIAAYDGHVQMEFAPRDYGHKLAGIPYGKVLDGQTIMVEAVSVPTILQKLGWSRIGLLKIDIEGYEGILLKERCEWLQYVDAICIECHEGYGESELVELAERWGFIRPQNLPGCWFLVRAIYDKKIYK